eukprot:gnl/MRDRNA2_/MRDRNA2_115577_c0_seq1.p1 gnl/MRDRNA2_/MRDRNA2_115577_c0~~gnl/MRDRNA2_/MRDRNA2_115577_c0_seq1.p1  ORF type:complete len:276 (-),score=61.81 gnl/MRDRNA2_/MRDRNA2_115577_c0_seq1:146-973(-)
MSADPPAAKRHCSKDFVIQGPGSLVYESQKSLHEYLHFHYGSQEDFLVHKCIPAESVDFNVRIASLSAKYAKPGKLKIAYDIGCAVGRSTFELTKTFEKVVGVDFSHAFIAAANAIKEKGELEYEVAEEGCLRSKHIAKVPAQAVASKAFFEQGDACNLGDIGQVDCILAANLLCRVPEPIAFLEKACQCIVPGGLLVLTTPRTWLEEYTSKDKWLGGKLDDKERPLDTYAELSSILGPFFDVVSRSDEPFLIREHRRKFHLILAETTVWRRKEV